MDVIEIQVVESKLVFVHVSRSLLSMLYSSSLENYCRLENYENEVHVTSFERNISIMDNR